MTPRLSRVRDALNQMARGAPVASAVVSLKLKSPLNGAGLATSRGARMADNARRKRERIAGEVLATCFWSKLKEMASSYSAAVVLTRVSPKPFDDDNLAAAFKSVRDGMATAWGIDDGGDAVTWLYDAEKGKPHTHEVRAELWVLSPAERPVDHFPALPDVDPSDYERPVKVVVHGGLIQRREARVMPNVIRAKGGA